MTLPSFRVKIDLKSTSCLEALDPGNTHDASVSLSRIFFCYREVLPGSIDSVDFDCQISRLSRLETEAAVIVLTSMSKTMHD
jgi:hypothetical protein